MMSGLKSLGNQAKEEAIKAAKEAAKEQAIIFLKEEFYEATGEELDDETIEMLVAVLVANKGLFLKAQECIKNKSIEWLKGLKGFLKERYGSKIEAIVFNAELAARLAKLFAGSFTQEVQENLKEETLRQVKDNSKTQIPIYEEKIVQATKELEEATSEEDKKKKKEEKEDLEIRLERLKWCRDTMELKDIEEWEKTKWEIFEGTGKKSKQALVGQLTKSDILAVTLYSDNKLPVFNIVNGILRVLLTAKTDEEKKSAEDSLLAWRQFVLHLSKATVGLPGYKGKLYRGQLYRGDEDKYVPGATVVWPAFTSCSTEEAISLEYSKGGLMFEIELEKEYGSFITTYSVYPQESECLLCPFTFFKVHDVKDIDGRKRIYMKCVGLPAFLSPVVNAGSVFNFGSDSKEGEAGPSGEAGDMKVEEKKDEKKSCCEIS